MKYFRKTCIVDAIQYTGENISEIEEFTNGKVLCGEELAKKYAVYRTYKNVNIIVLTGANPDYDFEMFVGDYVFKNDANSIDVLSKDEFEDSYTSLDSVTLSRSLDEPKEVINNDFYLCKCECPICGHIISRRISYELKYCEKCGQKLTLRAATDRELEASRLDNELDHLEDL